MSDRLSVVQAALALHPGFDELSREAPTPEQFEAWKSKLKTHALKLADEHILTCLLCQVGRRLACNELRQLRQAWHGIVDEGHAGCGDCHKLSAEEEDVLRIIAEKDGRLAKRG